MESRKEAIRKKRAKKTAVYRSCGAAFAVAGGILVLCGCSSKITASKPIFVPLPAAAAPVKNTQQQNITLSGYAEPYQEVPIFAPASGKIQELLVQLGASVDKGQKLATLDTSDLDNKIRQAEAQINRSQVEEQVKVIQQQISAAQAKASQSAQTAAADVANAETKVKNLETSFAQAQKNFELLSQASQTKKDNATDPQLTQAAAAKAQAESQLNEAKQMVDLLTSKADTEQQAAQEVNGLQQQLDQANSSLSQMDVEQAKIDLQNLQAQVENLQLVAPIRGIVTEPDTSTPIWGVSSKDTPLFDIDNFDQVYVKIDAPEAMIGKIQVNQAATATFPAIGKTVSGKVTYIGQMANLNTMTYPVRILLDNQEHLIRGGMRAQVTLK